MDHDLNQKMGDGGYERRGTDERLMKVEQVSYGLRGQMVAMEQAITGFGAQLAALDQHVRSNTNRPVNVAAWVSAGIALVGVMAITVGGIMTFISVSAAPLKEQQERQYVRQMRDQEFREQSIETMARLDEANRSLYKELEVLEDELRRIDIYGTRSLRASEVLEGRE